MGPHGFTLLELLIVVTIIAILAGAVLPYAQQYIDDSRIARAKQDLDEIRNALVRYEVDQQRIFTDTTITPLVGPYISKAMADPWGSPYVISSPKSLCYSLGPDRVDGSGDEVLVDFRPPLAISKAFHEDTNKNTLVDTGDKLLLKFTRPFVPPGPSLTVGTDFAFSEGTPANNYSALEVGDYNRWAKLTLDFGANPPFRTGLATIEAVPGNTVVDGNGLACKTNQPMVIKSL